MNTVTVKSMRINSMVFRICPKWSLRNTLLSFLIEAMKQTNKFPDDCTGIRNAKKQHLLHLDVHCDKVKVDEYLHFFGYLHLMPLLSALFYASEQLITQAPPIMC